MAENPGSESSRKEINILVLGETGVGKSTWINSFANYLQYESLEEAEKNDILTVIPTSFCITDDNYEERVITTGSDGNEVQRAGESATQRPRTYMFDYKKKDLTIRIIDTPGVGDSRGPNQDKINFQMIMDHLACYKEVHGVCILMKPNNARITVLFEFCIKHLLTHLHKDAIRNIVFCFTNARNTFYRPGETLRALRQLLANFQDLEIRLDKTTMYCVDNESIQYLAAVQAGLNFDDQHEVYAKSWEISSNETQRLLNYVIDLEPHVLQNTLSLNDARRVVLGLTQPLADIGRNIQKNILEAKKKEAEVKNTKADRHELEKHLYIPVVSFSVVYLERPYQVCTAGKCCKEIILDTGELSTKHNCRKPTKKSLFKLFKPKNCSRCGCPKTAHTDINYEIKEELKQEKCPRLEESIKKLDFSIENIRKEFLVEILDRIKVLEKEQAEILTISSQFAHFLKTNAIAPYNDTMIRYLDQQIETAKLSSNGSSDESLRLLMKMKQEYQAEVDVLKEKMESSTSKGIQAWDIPILKQELIGLPINGPYIRDILNQQDKAPAFGLDERVVEVNRRDGKKSDKPKTRKTMFGIPISPSSGNKAIKLPKNDRASNPIYHTENNSASASAVQPNASNSKNPAVQPNASNSKNLAVQPNASNSKNPAVQPNTSNSRNSAVPPNASKSPAVTPATSNSNKAAPVATSGVPKRQAPSVPDRKAGITRQSAAQTEDVPNPPPAAHKPKSEVKIPPRPVSQTSSSVGPQPPPPPAQPDFPATVRAAGAVDGVRSALLTQIHKGISLKKVDQAEMDQGSRNPKPSPRTASGTGESEYTNTSHLTPKLSLDAALKKALQERYISHKSDSTENVVEDADSDWQD